MKRIICYAAIMMGWALLAGTSQAQFPGRPAGFGQGGFGQGGGRIATSPYLNLLHGGNPAINYYGLVRPQVAAAQAFQTLGSNIVDLETSAANQPVQTGVAASFMTHRGYFMNNGASAAFGGGYGGGSLGGGAIGRGQGGAGAAAPPPPRR